MGDIGERLWRVSVHVPFARMRVVSTELRKLSGQADATVLDLGCGDGRSAGLLFGNRRNGLRVTGVDAFEPSIREAERLGVYESVLLGDVKRLPIQPKSFDIVMLLEVLEHMPRDEGEELLVAMEAVSRNGVIVTTPGYCDRETLHTETEDAAYFTALYKNEVHRMPHITIWSPEEFRRLGYEVKGSQVSPTRIPRFVRPFGLALSACLAPLTYRCPSLAASLIAVKAMSTNESAQR